jgi:hypothetical protein
MANHARVDLLINWFKKLINMTHFFMHIPFISFPFLFPSESLQSQRTPLHAARDVETIKYFLSKGANIFAKVSFSFSGLLFSFHRNEIETNPPIYKIYTWTYCIDLI